MLLALEPKAPVKVRWAFFDALADVPNRRADRVAVGSASVSAAYGRYVQRIVTVPTN